MAIFDALAVIFSDIGTWFPQMLRHTQLSGLALILSIAIGVPVGAWLTRVERAAFAVISIANLGRTIPSLALLALVYPFVGTGFKPALIALVALGIPPILLGTYTGIREIDPNIPEAAKGMGMTSIERLLQAELPAAASIIVSGTRTSAVQIVASATLAALIGGGGLGELILAGLANMRYDLLIAGAMLVALLAVATEMAFSLLERRALPKGIRAARELTTQTSNDYSAGSALDRDRWLKVAGGSTVVAACLVFAGLSAAGFVDRLSLGGIAAAHDKSLPTVTIGSKDFTEQLVLGELYAYALEAQGYRVQRKLNLGATGVADSALRRGDISLYPEYTGTALYAVLKSDVDEVTAPARDAGSTGEAGPPDAAERSAQVYRAVADGYAKRGMTLLAATPFSNGHAIVVTQETAEKHKLRTMSDLAKVSGQIVFAAAAGFDTREDQMPLLEAEYGMSFKKLKTFETGLKYKALLSGKVEAIHGFETDGQIARHKLVLLEDDRMVWPPYHAVPIVDSKFAAKAGPAFAATINSVTALLDRETMQKLNDAVEEDKQDPADVAIAFLKKHGMLTAGPRPKVTIGSKDFTEQLLLGEMYAQALEARGFPVERRLNLGATAVADNALRSGKIDMYPEYTGTALTAVLKQPVRRGQSAADVLAAVKAGYEQRQMRVLAPTPFSNGNAIVMKKATAARLGISSLSDLRRSARKLRFGSVPGFDKREDGMPMLRSAYGIGFGSIKTYEIGLRYKALLDGKVDAVYGFETDGQIAAHDLTVLADDKRVWPPYNAVPVISEQFAAEVGPEFSATVNTVTGLLDADTMRGLIDQVDRGHEDPPAVAASFLEKHGLLALSA